MKLDKKSSIRVNKLGDGKKRLHRHRKEAKEVNYFVSKFGKKYSFDYDALIELKLYDIKHDSNEHTAFLRAWHRRLKYERECSYKDYRTAGVRDWHRRRKCAKELLNPQ